MSTQIGFYILQTAVDTRLLTADQAAAVDALPAELRAEAVDAVALLLTLPAALTAAAVVDQVDAWLADGEAVPA